MKKTLLIKILSATKGAFVNKGFLFCFLLSAFCFLPCSAQEEFDYLDVNNVKAYINPLRLFYNNGAAFEVPKNSGKSTIFTSNIWLGGVDIERQLYVAAQRYTGQDFWLGPIGCFDTIIDDYHYCWYGSPPDEEYIQKYHHTWKVSRAEIEYHKVHYKDAGYVMPWGIANWPAHGRVEENEDYYLAPYKDRDGNGKYEPLKGDYPDIKGDQAVFFIMNDRGGPHTGSGSFNSMGVQICGMAYAFNSPDSALQNTIFLSYEVKNKGSANLDDFYFGFWNDFDIGYKMDDYIGCDTLMNLAYAYNGKEIDGTGQANAYGENPPVQGCIFLNQKMSAFMAHKNNNSITGAPSVAIDYYNLLRARWRNGMHVTYGGTGENYPGVQTSFMFSGDPINKTGWTELTPDGPESTPNTPGDRMGVMSAGPFTLDYNETISVEIALIFARDYGSKNPLASLAKLKQFTQEVQEYYDEVIADIKETQLITSLRVYPNPSNGQFTISGDKVIESIEVYDLLGKKVFTSTPKSQTTQINTRLPQGLYMYRAVLEDHSSSSGKIVIR